MGHTIDFQNWAQFQSNLIFMEEVENEDMRKLLSTLLEGLLLPENHFFQDDNTIPKKKMLKQNTVTRS